MVALLSCVWRGAYFGVWLISWLWVCISVSPVWFVFVVIALVLVWRWIAVFGVGWCSVIFTWVFPGCFSLGCIYGL